MTRPHSGDERREFRRFHLASGQLRAEVSAAGFVVSAALVQDISRGGVRLSLGESLLDGTGAGTCIVRFLDDSNRVRPATARGSIRRNEVAVADYQVAIEFTEPLEALHLSS